MITMFECDGILLEPCLLQPCFHVAGPGREAAVRTRAAAPPAQEHGSVLAGRAIYIICMYIYIYISIHLYIYIYIILCYIIL